MRDGLLYYTARRDNNRPLSRISFADGTQETDPLWMSGARGLELDPQVRGVIFEPSGARYWVVDGHDAWAVDSVTHTLIDADGDPSNGDSAIYMAGRMRAHLLVVSPY